MRNATCAAMMILLASAACDNKQDKPAEKAADPASSSADASVADAAAAEVDAAKPVVAMPERPVPKPQTMISSSAPIEVQQKAIGYMVAMRAPHPDDVAADPAYANDLAAKLKPIVLALDTGADKAKLDHVDVVASGRQIDLLMAGGCDATAPQRAVVNRAAVPLATLVSHGVLVIRCNDARVQCLQSTRDPEDVLCTTAPRHK